MDYSYEKENYFYNELIKFVKEKNINVIDDKKSIILFAMKKFYLNAHFVGNTIENSHPGIQFILSKSAKDVLGIYYLMLKGNLPQALLLLRSLYETGLYTKYIFQSFEKRIDLYWNHRNIGNYEAIKKYSKTLKKHPKIFDEEHKHYVIANYQRVKDDYIKYKPWYYKELLKDIEKNPLLKNNKTPSLSSLSLIVGEPLGGFYKSIYSIGSDFTHGNSSSKDFYLSDKYEFSLSPIYDTSKMWLFRIVTLVVITEIYSSILKHKVKEDPKYQYYLDYIYSEFEFYKSDMARKEDYDLFDISNDIKKKEMDELEEDKQIKFEAFYQIAREIINDYDGVTDRKKIEVLRGILKEIGD